MRNIKIFGIGGLGCSVIGKIPETEKLPVFALDTCVCPFNWLECEKLLCGRDVCKGLWCGGSVEKGYEAAVETLKDNMQLFTENEINIFVVGLGGGAGSGIIKYILERLAEVKKDLNNKNKHNLLIATFPLSIEHGRVIKANKVLGEITGLSEMILLLKLTEIARHANEPLRVQQLFTIVDASLVSLLTNMMQLENNAFEEYIDTYIREGSVIKEITSLGALQNTFSHQKKTTPVKMNTHFTGQGRDLEQLKAASQYIRNDDSLMFVGCSTGEEISDLQALLTTTNQAFGIDYDADIIGQAQERNYATKPTLFSADILKNDFGAVVAEKTNNKTFDVVICRNLLIYYEEEAVKKIIEQLSELTNRMLILGISDPVDIVTKGDIAQIGTKEYKIIDFNNRIFEKIH